MLSLGSTVTKCVNVSILNEHLLMTRHTIKSAWWYTTSCCNKMYNISVRAMYSKMYKEYKRVAKLDECKVHKVNANT